MVHQSPVKKHKRLNCIVLITGTTFALVNMRISKKAPFLPALLLIVMRAFLSAIWYRIISWQGIPKLTKQLAAGINHHGVIEHTSIALDLL